MHCYSLVEPDDSIRQTSQNHSSTAAQQLSRSAAQHLSNSATQRLSRSAIQQLRSSGTQEVSSSSAQQLRRQSRGGQATCLRGSNLKRNLGLSDSEGPRYPLKIRFGVFRGLQRLPSGHKEVAGSPQGKDIAAKKRPSGLHRRRQRDEHREPRTERW